MKETTKQNHKLLKKLSALSLKESRKYYLKKNEAYIKYVGFVRKMGWRDCWLTFEDGKLAIRYFPLEGEDPFVDVYEGTFYSYVKDYDPVKFWITDPGFDRIALRILRDALGL